MSTTKKPARATSKQPASGAAGASAPRRTSSVRSSLERAAKAAGAGDRAAAVEALLLAWRASPAAAIAEALSRISALGFAPELALPAAGKHVDMKAWKALLAQGHPLGLGVLLDALGRVPQPALKEQIEALGKQPPDPRVAAAYVRLIQRPPFTASALKSAWTDLFSQLRGAHLDPRTAPTLAPLAGQYTKVFGFSTMGSWMDGQLGKLVLDLSAHPPAPALSSDEAELLEQALQALAPPAAPAPSAASMRSTASAPSPPADPERALLDAIAAAPREQAPREAHLAWCKAHDPERAEFIELGRKRAGGRGTAADGKREEALLKKHWKRWLGPLAHVVVGPTPEDFEGGYLTRAMFSASARKAPLAVGDPRWATVHTIAFQGMNRVPTPVFLDPVLRSWRVAREVSLEFFEALSSHDEPLPLEHLETEGPDPRAFGPDYDPVSLRNVRELHVSTWMRLDRSYAIWESVAVFRPLWQTRWLERVQDVFIDCPPDTGKELLAELNEHVPAKVRAAFHAEKHVFERNKKGRYQAAGAG